MVKFCPKGRSKHDRSSHLDGKIKKYLESKAGQEWCNWHCCDDSTMRHPIDHMHERLERLGRCGVKDRPWKSSFGYSVFPLVVVADEEPVLEKPVERSLFHPARHVRQGSSDCCVIFHQSRRFQIVHYERLWLYSLPHVVVVGDDGAQSEVVLAILPLKTRHSCTHDEGGSETRVETPIGPNRRRRSHPKLSPELESRIFSQLTYSPCRHGYGHTQGVDELRREAHPWSASPRSMDASQQLSNKSFIHGYSWRSNLQSNLQFCLLHTFFDRISRWQKNVRTVLTRSMPFESREWEDSLFHSLWDPQVLISTKCFSASRRDLTPEEGRKETRSTACTLAMACNRSIWRPNR